MIHADADRAGRSILTRLAAGMRRTFVLMDLVAVLVFVGIGRGVHAHGLGLDGVVSTAWPFVSGLAVGWMLVLARRQELVSLASGLWVSISTVALGMALRVVAGQGTAVPFVIVALGFLGAAMLGWRWCRALLGRRQRPGRTS